MAKDHAEIFQEERRAPRPAVAAAGGSVELF
jgi:hypothetical protein